MKRRKTLPGFDWRWRGLSTAALAMSALSALGLAAAAASAAALANNGGPTDTQALTAGSPALDTADSAVGVCPATDQRGVTRPRGPACDLGAYER